MVARIDRVAPESVLEVRHRNLRAHTTIDEAAFDGDDHPLAGHFLVVIEAGVVAVASVTPENRHGRADEWRIRGMATDPRYRGRGYGTQLLATAMQWAWDHGAAVIWCNARIGAKNLYLRAGFQPVGEEFEPQHLGPHIQMERQRLEAQS